MINRATLAKIHRFLGLTLGLVFALMCCTGMILALEDDLVDYLDRDLKQSGTFQSLEKVYLAASQQLQPGERVGRIYLQTNSVRIQSKSPSRILYFDLEDGHYLGQGTQFLNNVLYLHRQLLLGNFGRMFTMSTALALLFLTPSGLSMWWPRKLKNLSKNLKIKTGGSKRRLLFDIHRVGGAYVAVPLFLIALTGLNFSLLKSPYQSAVYFLTGSGPLPKPAPVEASDNSPISFQQAIKISQQALPRATPTELHPPAKAGSPIVVRLLQPGAAGPSIVTMHPTTGEILLTQDTETMPLGHKLTRTWLYPFHSARLFGRPHQLLWILVVLTGLLLPLTGIRLWWTKRARKES